MVESTNFVKDLNIVDSNKNKWMDITINSQMIPEKIYVYTYHHIATCNHLAKVVKPFFVCFLLFSIKLN